MCLGSSWVLGSHWGKTTVLASKPIETIFNESSSPSMPVSRGYSTGGTTQDDHLSQRETRHAQQEITRENGKQTQWLLCMRINNEPEMDGTDRAFALVLHFGSLLDSRLIRVYLEGNVSCADIFADYALVYIYAMFFVP
ncbi:hypothetical protein AX15_001469 [Amanita polypyramis BW_CC]|nr:hypothetical protein AX15_001469 [Amanita polypyramis BW_CC]